MQQLARSPVLALLMLTFVLGEMLWRTRIARRGYNSGAAWTSLALGLGNLISGSIGALALGLVFTAATRLTPLHWPIDDWRSWAVGFVAVEFAYYWFHRCSHTVRWLWATHAVHHTPQELTFLSALRLGWTNLLSCGWLFYLPLVLLGFDPRLVFTLLAIDLHYQFFLHTEAFGNWGPLEWVLNTPRHHRVHHAANPAYLDCNYGGVLIVFDRLFGSFVSLRAEEPIRYGLVHPLASNNPLRIAFGEWQRLLGAMVATRSVRGAVRVALGRP